MEAGDGAEAHQELAGKALTRCRARMRKPVLVFLRSFRRVFGVFAVGFWSFRTWFLHGSSRILPNECRGRLSIMQKLLYTTTEAKAVIGCGTTRLYELINSGELEARRLGHRTMIEAESLRELVDSLPRVTTPTMRRRASGDTEPKRVV